MRKLTHLLAVLAVAAGLIVAVQAPASAVGCTSIFVPSIGNATLNTAQGPLPMSYSANYTVSAGCTKVKARNLLYSDCPGARVGAFGQVRVMSGGGGVIGPLNFFTCGSSTWKDMIPNILPGTLFRVEFTNSPQAVQFNVSINR